MLDAQTAQSILKKHWDTVRPILSYNICPYTHRNTSKWITEDDFRQIQAAGLNHVRYAPLPTSSPFLPINTLPPNDRLPIGYWSVPLTSADTSGSTSTAPYVSGAWPYFLRALSWAQKYNINVILDLHGAPGSQNGYDNSGQRTGNPIWGVSPANVTRTVDTLRFLAKEVGSQVSVIELLNEAAGFRGDDWASAVRQFWLDGYDAVREAAGQGVKVMIGDAFLTVNVSYFYFGFYLC